MPEEETVEEAKTMVRVGDHVRFTDQVGRTHDALVTAVHGGNVNLGDDEAYLEDRPSLNLVWVNDDPEHYDQYGRQIKRDTSITHRGDQAAHGFYWHHPDE